jgi:hypothetical protein
MDKAIRMAKAEVETEMVETTSLPPQLFARISKITCTIREEQRISC